MPKLIDSRQREYFDPPETYLCEPASSSVSDIQKELDAIPSSAPAGSIAEILLSSGLKVKMKNSQNQWIDV